MKLKQIPDLPAQRYPKRVNIAISSDTDEKLKKLRALNKDTAAYLRAVIERALSEIDGDLKSAS